MIRRSRKIWGLCDQHATDEIHLRFGCKLLRVKVVSDLFNSGKLSTEIIDRNH